MSVSQTRSNKPTVIPKRMNPVQIKRDSGLLKDVLVSLAAGDWAPARQAGQVLRSQAYFKALEITRSDRLLADFTASSNDNMASLNEVIADLDVDEADLRKLFIQNADELGGLNSPRMKRAWVLMTNKDVRKQYLDMLGRLYRHPFGNLNWEWPMKMAVVGLYGQVLAGYQEAALQQQGRLVTDELQPSILDDVGVANRNVTGFLSEVQQQLQLEDRDSLRKVSIAYINHVELILEDMVGWLASTQEITAGAVDTGLKSEQRKAGELCLDVAAMVRLCIWSYALAYHLLKLSGLPASSSVWRQAVRDALELPMASAIEDGVNVSVKQLMEKPGSYIGKMVEATGRVKGLRSFRESADKVATMFTLTDVADDNTGIQVSLSYANLTTRGLVDDCLIHLNGKVYQSEQDNEYRVRLDRLAYSALKKQSWLDAMANEVNKVFPLWPERLNAVWSYTTATDDRPPSGVYEIFNLAKFAD
ncbi:MAG: hypothetical protein PVF91_09770 [Chromatiales bacterium]|jgi:hypothetical protein